MITIIKNAPPPAPLAKYPFAGMEVGDAFDCPRCGESSTGSDLAQIRINASASSWNRRRGGKMKFTVRIIDDKTVRCYRIA
jgi:hypothetical protein